MAGSGGSGGGGGGGSVASQAREPENQAAGQLDQAAGEVDSFMSEAVSAMQDPLSMLVGTGVEFVIDWVTPVKEAIQLVTGDAPALEASAEKFSALNKSAEQLAQELAETFDSQLSNWQGEAADAARKKMASFVEGVKNTGLQAHNISELLKMSAVMMEAAEGVIKGILADFLTWAIVTWITALATAGPTLGGSTAAATGVTVAEAAITTSRAATQVQRILKIIETIGTVITAIQAIIDAIRVVDAVQTITSGTGNEKSGDELKSASEAAGKAGEHVSAAGENVTSVAEAAGIETEPAQDGTGQDASTAGSGSDGQSTSNTDGTATTDSGSDASTSDGSTSSTAGSDGSTDSATGDGANGNAADAGNGPGIGGSAVEHGTEQLGTAADSLQEQAKSGGFSQVPADKSISGDLSF